MLNIALLTLLLASSEVHAEQWVALRKPVERLGDPPQILVDASSIDILEMGIRRARVKVDFLGSRPPPENIEPAALIFMILIKSYDCENKLRREDSMEFHSVDGSVHTSDPSKQAPWYPAPENPAADPTIGYVCTWKRK